jgi:hypothetical protein
MKLPANLVPELIPQGVPDDKYSVGKIGLLAKTIEEPLFRRSFLWSSALTIAGLESMLEVPPRLSGISSGFVYIDEHLRPDIAGAKVIDGFAFGICLLISIKEEKRQEIRMLKIGSMVYPVVLNYGLYEPHGLPTHPGSGSGSCWVINNRTGTWSKGILTCRHTMTGCSIGSRVPLHQSAYHSTPTLGTLADKDIISTIDAAIVEINQNDWPNGLSPLPICRAVAPGQSVSFEGRSSTQGGTVLRAFQHTGYFGNLFGQRVFTDCIGISGDSGSLLFDRSSGDGLAIYMGSVPDGAGGYEGLFQDLSQAALYFDFSAYI